MADLHEFTGPNEAYVLDLYERYLADPRSVDEGWRAFFSTYRAPARPAPAAAPAPAAGAVADAAKIVAAHELARAIRGRGHTAARLDPLGGQPMVDPALEPAWHGLSEADLAALPADVVWHPPVGARNALEAVQRLREIYSGPVGYEFLHLPDPDERGWLRDAIEGSRFGGPMAPERKRALLERLSQVEGFERFLHRAFFGQKRFSIEGNDSMVPILDEIIRDAAAGGARDVVIGMAHRGRLNVLTHVLRKPYELMLAGFAATRSAAAADDEQNSDEPSGDVKYHMGWRDVREVDGQRVQVTLSPNPSHLEFVNPVVIGMTRAAQDDASSAPGAPEIDPTAALAVLIHGDAAFPGQGVVPETFNMSQLAGYRVGGTVHVIANNQVGFTTDPDQSRSTRYSSDLAKGFEVPVVHVNADDPEACLMVARLAQAYRQRWGKDFVIDLVGYRRWGHNEGDEPLFTQPVMYETVRNHPTAREGYARRLAAEGVVSEADAAAMLQRVTDELQRILDAGPRAELAHPESHSGNGRHPVAQTAVPAEALVALNEAMLARPDGFTPNPRLEKVLQKRRDAMGPEGGIDWGHAEALAVSSLLVEGVPVRITGQDVERGTFSHRHAVLRDAKTGRRLNVFHQVPKTRATFEIHNSPLTEMAVLGFEFGYTMTDRQALVIWEAQFGDFANGAQVIIDQFLASSQQKWERESGLVLLLPHGYEGQGPEHSSARLERFLQLCAEENLRVANCTTAAQYFHLLRRQAVLLLEEPCPLVVMSPKSLLRHPLAASRLDDLTAGTFRPVLPDPTTAGREAGVTRLVLCSGKVYVDLVGTGEEQRADRAAIPGVERVAIARVEELYPFPDAELGRVIAGLPALREVVWTQEEPRNMGAWSFMEPRLRAILPDGVELRYEGRPDRASPAEGYAHRHAVEQARLVRAALADAPGAELAVPSRDAAERRAG